MLSDVTKRRVDHRSAGEEKGWSRDGGEAAISMTKETDDRSDAASLGEEGRK